MFNLDFEYHYHVCPVTLWTSEWKRLIFHLNQYLHFLSSMYPSISCPGNWDLGYQYSLYNLVKLMTNIHYLHVVEILWFLNSCYLRYPGDLFMNLTICLGYYRSCFLLLVPTFSFCLMEDDEIFWFLFHSF